MKFSDMPYSRVDIDALRASYAALTEKVKDAASAQDVADAVMEHEKLSGHAYTMFSLAHCRHTIDTRDEYYVAENDFCDETSPLLDEMMQQFLVSLVSSPYRTELEKRFGALLFVNIEMQLKCFDPAIVPQLQEENRLVSDYEKLVAGAQIEFDGKTLNLAQLSPYKESADREVRRGAYYAEGNYYMSVGDKLDELYDSLIRVRTDIAHKLGYKSFTEVAYLRLTRNSYGPADVERFRKQVVDEVVPIDKMLKKLQGERIGISDMKMYDDPFCFREGNPKPQGTSDEILAAGRRMYTEMSPQTAEFIDFMYKNELLDVLAKPGKAVGGYCTEFREFGAPFIFSNFNGTSGDVDVLTHEAGHAYEAYKTMGFEIAENSQPTMESCEVHSMSMEFFAWKWLDLFYGDETARAKFRHLEDALIFIPYGTMVDHFQHIMYDKPELTPAQRHETWAKLEKTYRPYMDFEEIPFYSAGRGWQRQHHIYSFPFYYIDYCLAQTVALMFWALSQNDYKDAWERYNKLVDCGGTKRFTELCAVAGLKSPFEEGCLRSTCETARSWLSHNA
ncbi:MAG: M3 family oligoendopeptidase [Eubacteriales bacterium]